MAKKRVYVIDFKEPILKLRTALGDPELPTIDLDVVISILFEVFEKDDIPQAINRIVLKIMEPGWLIENPAWVDEREEKKQNEIIYSALHNFAWEMYRLMEDSGLFHNPHAKYSYKRMLNDFTLTFTPNA